MIDINYNITHDYSNLYNNEYIKIEDKLNTLLVPTDLYNTLNTSLKLVNNKNKHYVVDIIDAKQTIDINNIIYHKLFIFPSLPFDTYYFNNIKFNQSLNDHNPKIINGLMVLANNFLYKFIHAKFAILLIDNIEYVLKINSCMNKYNTYAAFTKSTVLDLFNTSNTDVLSKLNQSINNKYIRPICSANYPLGSLDISIYDSLGVYDYILKLNDMTIDIKKRLYIDYLRAGQYNISLLDKDKSIININLLNNKVLNSTNYNISINKIVNIASNYKPSNNIKKYLSLK